MAASVERHNATLTFARPGSATSYTPSRSTSSQTESPMTPAAPVTSKSCAFLICPAVSVTEMLFGLPPSASASAALPAGLILVIWYWPGARPVKL